MPTLGHCPIILYGNHLPGKGVYEAALGSGCAFFKVAYTMYDSD